MLTKNCWLLPRAFMQPYVQHGARCVKFLDTFIQEQSILRCRHRRILVAVEKIPKCPRFGIHGRKEAREG